MKRAGRSIGATHTTGGVPNRLNMRRFGEQWHENRFSLSRDARFLASIVHWYKAEVHDDGYRGKSH
jgi:hypothetical protein